MNLPRWAAVVALLACLAGCGPVAEPTPLASWPSSTTTPAPTTTSDVVALPAPSPTPSTTTDLDPTTTTSAAATTSRSARVAASVSVARVIDGDTVELSDGRTVRVLGIDTPETVAPGQPVECFGPEASAFAKRYLVGTVVTVSGVRVKPDRYGRTLANLGTPAGDYGMAAVTGGYARIYRADTTAALRSAESAARSAKRGLWAGCAVSTPAPRSTTVRATPRADGPAVTFSSCAAARAAGAAPVRRGQPGYSARLDRDGDGVGCE